MRAVSSYSQYSTYAAEALQRLAKANGRGKAPAGSENKQAEAKTQKVKAESKPAPATAAPSKSDRSTKPQAAPTEAQVTDLGKQVKQLKKNLEKLQSTDAEGDAALKQQINDKSQKLQEQLDGFKQSDAKSDAALKEEINDKFEKLRQQFNDTQKTHAKQDAKQDAKLAESLKSLGEQVQQLQDRDDNFAAAFDQATDAIQSLRKELENVQELLAGKGDKEQPGPSDGGTVTNVDVDMILEGFAERLGDLTVKFEEYLDSQEPAAAKELLNSVEKSLEDANRGAAAIKLGRSERSNARLARLVTDLTVKIQASVSLFQINQGGFGGRSDGSAPLQAAFEQLLSYAFQSSTGSRVNLMA